MGERDGDGIGQSAIDDLDAFGVQHELEADAHDIVVDVEPENADAVRLFRQMQTQWKVSPFVAGKHIVYARTGLDYAALGPVSAALKIEITEATLDAIRVLEQECLA